MSIALPKPIADYFAADADPTNRAAVAECFNETATVTDERNTYHGRDAIRQWKDGPASKYSYTSTPFALEQKDGKTIVTSHLVGNFPGHETDLRYVFTLDGQKIAALDIVP